jgi:hypothetical protein
MSISWNLKVHCHIHNNKLLGHVLNQVNPDALIYTCKRAGTEGNGENEVYLDITRMQEKIIT